MSITHQPTARSTRTDWGPTPKSPEAWLDRARDVASTLSADAVARDLSLIHI